MHMSTVFDVLRRFRLCKGFPVLSRKTHRQTQEVRLLGPPKNGSVVMISQLPSTSALLTITFYCNSTHDL